MNRNFPTSVIAGDTLKFTINSSPYTVTDGFGINVNFVGPSGNPTQYTEAAASTADTTFELSVAPAVTALYAEGHYNYAIVADDDTDEFTLEQGTFEVTLRADLNANNDLRTHARKTLDAIEAVIEGRATKTHLNHTIGGRSIQYMSPRDLIEFRKYYKDLVSKEDGSYRYKIKVRF